MAKTLAFLGVFLMASVARADVISDIDALKAQVEAYGLDAPHQAILVNVLSLAEARVKQHFPAAAKMVMANFSSYVSTFTNEGFIDPVTGALWESESLTIQGEL